MPELLLRCRAIYGGRLHKWNGLAVGQSINTPAPATTPPALVQGGEASIPHAVGSSRPSNGAASMQEGALQGQHMVFQAPPDTAVGVGVRQALIPNEVSG